MSKLKRDFFEIIKFISLSSAFCRNLHYIEMKVKRFIQIRNYLLCMLWERNLTFFSWGTSGKKGYRLLFLYINLIFSSHHVNFLKNLWSLLWFMCSLKFKKKKDLEGKFIHYFFLTINENKLTRLVNESEIASSSSCYSTKMFFCCCEIKIFASLRFLFYIFHDLLRNS